MLLVILNDAEAHVDRWINIILDETEKELRPLKRRSLVDIERVDKVIHHLESPFIEVTKSQI